MDCRKIGFIGGGAMASAIIKGLIRSGISPQSLSVADIDPQNLDALKREGVNTTLNNTELIGSDILIFAVKPDVVCTVLQEIREVEQRDPPRSYAMIVSIAAGISISQLEMWNGPRRKIVRVMPNTPCLVGEAAAAFSVNSCITSDDKSVIIDLFSRVGLILEVQEKYMSAVTGLSGSGPAYAFMMIEAMADGGVRMGLKRDIAQKLAAQTLKGAAEMVLKTGSHPGTLKDMVCSPGGMTIAAVETLESKGFRSAAMNAVMTSAYSAIEAEEASSSKKP